MDLDALLLGIAQERNAWLEFNMAYWRSGFTFIIQYFY